jgi:hypothetical protein
LRCPDYPAEHAGIALAGYGDVAKRIPYPLLSVGGADYRGHRAALKFRSPCDHLWTIAGDIGVMIRAISGSFLVTLKEGYRIRTVIDRIAYRRGSDGVGEGQVR